MSGRALFACAGFFAPFCSPCPLRCSAQALGFGFYWALLLPWCALARCGVTMHFCAWLFCFCSVVVFSFLFFSGSDDSRGRGEDPWNGSGSLAGLAGGSPGFFNPVMLVCFGAFFALFFLGVLFGLLLCPRVCLLLLRTRSLSAFCAIPPLDFWRRP